MAELDPATLQAAQRGDTRAFRRLVECYQQRVFALCAALAGNDAEDLAQETFVRVFEAVARFKPDGAATLGTWILVVARRLCQDRARGARLRVEVAASDLPEAVSASWAAPDQGPEHALLESRLRQRLARALHALPEDQRAAIALREWDGLDYEQIAVIEGVAIGTIRSRLARARDALRAAIEDPGKGIHAAE